MEYLTEEDEAKYKEHFASYIENEITFEDVEEMYKETHKAIREDPSPAPKTAFTPDKSFKNAVSACLEWSAGRWASPPWLLFFCCGRLLFFSAIESFAKLPDLRVMLSNCAPSSHSCVA